MSRRSNCSISESRPCTFCTSIPSLSGIKQTGRASQDTPPVFVAQGKGRCWADHIFERRSAFFCWNSSSVKTPCSWSFASRSRASRLLASLFAGDGEVACAVRSSSSQGEPSAGRSEPVQIMIRSISDQMPKPPAVSSLRTPKP